MPVLVCFRKKAAACVCAVFVACSGVVHAADLTLTGLDPSSDLYDTVLGGQGGDTLNTGTGQNKKEGFEILNQSLLMDKENLIISGIKTAVAGIAAIIIGSLLNGNPH